MSRVLVIAVSAMLLSGCATVTRGTTDQIQIVSEPPGVQARTSLGHSCVTPCTIQVQRKDEFAVIFDDPRFEPLSIPVGTKVQGSGATGFAGNILLGGLIGMGVDASTGAAYDHFPNPVMGQMVPLPQRPPYMPPRAPPERPRGPKPSLTQ